LSQADDIRKFVIVNYISPARSRGGAQVSVRVGDVHREMDLSNAMPAVCSAIGSNKFWEEAGVREINRDGPANSSTVVFTFAFDQSSAVDVAVAEAELRVRHGNPDVDNEKIISFMRMFMTAICLCCCILTTTN
jgi:5-methylcytosine-specific restriction enzyme B